MEKSRLSYCLVAAQDKFSEASQELTAKVGVY